jgi:hypothetical protein
MGRTVARMFQIRSGDDEQRMLSMAAARWERAAGSLTSRKR